MAQNGISTYVSLDIDVLKIAQGRTGRGQPALTGLVARKITTRSDDEIAAVLQEAVALLPRKPREVEILLPRHFVIVRTLELPSHDDNELRELAGFQAVKQTPYALDEMVLDVEILEKNSSDFSKVLLVVVQKDVVDRLLRVAKKANLKVRAIRLSTEGHEAYFLAAQAKTGAQTAGLSGGFFSIDYSRSHLCVFNGGICRYSRSIPLGWRNVNGSPASDAVFQQKIADELELSSTAYRKENPGKQIGNLWFESSVTGWNTLTENLRQSGFGTVRALQADVLAADPHAKIDIEPGLDICRSDLLGGLAMPKVLALNLMPEESKRHLQGETRRRNLIQMAALSSLFLALCLVYYAERIIDKQMYLKQLQQKINAIKSKAEFVEARSEKMEVLRGIGKNQGEVVRVIQELYMLFPASVSVANISYERGHTLVIKGTAKDLSDVFQMIPVLEKSPYFENVTSQYASKRRVFDKEYTDFQIQCIIQAYTPPQEPS